MSNPKGKTIPNTITMYLVIFALYCIDIFFLQSDRSVLGDAFYSRIAGLIVLSGYVWMTRDSLSLFGISKKKEKLKTGAIYGTLFSVVPLFAVIAVEAVFFGISDINALDLQFSPPSMKFVRDAEILTPSAAVFIYFFTSLVGSVFKEFTFRGYILKKLKRVLGFRSANILQAVLYMFMTMPMLLRNQIMGYYDKTTSSVIVFIVFFYIVHETIAGIKWGLLTRVTGATYVAIVDHFLLVFLANSIYITDRYVTWSFMTHMLAIQIISFLLVLIYYKKNIRKIKEKSSEKSGDKKDADSKARKNREKIDEQLNDIDEISPEQYKSIVDDAKDRKTETVSMSDISKAAGMQIESSYSTPHHHHHHHRHHRSGSHSHSHSHSRELESFDSEEIAKKTEEYSESLSLERKTPKHPHPHDTIALDSRLSEEELDKANEGKAVSFENNDIDAFLKNFSEENSGSHHHHRHSHGDSFDESTDITEGFDADKYLKDYQKHSESGHSPHHHSSKHHHSSSHSDSHSSSHHHSSSHSGSHHHSSHHHHTHEHSVHTNSETALTDKEYQKIVSDLNKKTEEKSEKRNLFDKIRDLGKIDDTDSNDLI